MGVSAPDERYVVRKPQNVDLGSSPRSGQLVRQVVADQLECRLFRVLPKPASVVSTSLISRSQISLRVPAIFDSSLTYRLSRGSPAATSRPLAHAGTELSSISVSRHKGYTGARCRLRHNSILKRSKRVVKDMAFIAYSVRNVPQAIAFYRDIVG